MELRCHCFPKSIFMILDFMCCWYGKIFDRAVQDNTSYDDVRQEWGEWGGWSTCSRTCGSGGTKKRGRDCVDVTNNINLFGELANCNKELGVAGEMEMSCNQEVECSTGKYISSLVVA